MISINNLTKKYGEVTAVNNVSLEIKRGDIVGLIGANGAGKTSLIEIILGITHPTSGTIKFDFKYIKSPLEKIGVQFQDSNYPFGLTVNEIIDFFVDLSTVKINKKTFNKMIVAFEMKDFFYRNASSLSGGQKQKLNVFLALVSNPEIVFLDELTTGLDIKVSQSITKFLVDFIKNGDKTMILVSHNPSEIEKLCNRMVVMKNGSIVFNKTKQLLKKEYQSVALLMEQFI